VGLDLDLGGSSLLLSSASVNFNFYDSSSLLSLRESTIALIESGSFELRDWILLPNLCRDTMPRVNHHQTGALCCCQWKEVSGTRSPHCVDLGFAPRDALPVLSPLRRRQLDEGPNKEPLPCLFILICGWSAAQLVAAIVGRVDARTLQGAQGTETP
jgi:hypothetical protein